MSKRGRRMSLTPPNITIAPQVPAPLTPALRTTFNPFTPTVRTTVNRNRRDTISRPPSKITDYHLVKELGRGSYGTVWLAKSKTNGQVCAIKVVEKRKVWVSNNQEQLVRESKIMKKLSLKPFTLQLYESFANPKYVFLALELAEMGDLQALLEKVKFMEFGEMSYYLVQIAGGLNAIHNTQIVYRDLKPENVLLNAQGHVKLADFGLSKYVGSSNGRANSICGSLGFMAPEVLRGDVYSYTADWYSFGILIHQIYIGISPYKSHSDTASCEYLRNSILTGEIELSSCLSPGARNFFRWLTEMRPENRPQTMNDLRKHPWVSNFPWVDILAKKIPAPYVLSPSQYAENEDDLSDDQVDYSQMYEAKDFEVDVYGGAFAEF